MKKVYIIEQHLTGKDLLYASEPYQLVDVYASREKAVSVVNLMVEIDINQLDCKLEVREKNYVKLSYNDNEFIEIFIKEKEVIK